VPEFGKGTSSAAEAEQTAPIAQSAEELTIVPKVPTVESSKAKDDKVEEPQAEEVIQVLDILSPPANADLPKIQKTSTTTPKRRRMACVLDAVLETTKALSPTPTKKIVEAAKTQAEAETGQAETEATQAQAKAKAGPSVPTETEPAMPEERTTK
jgi:hypothetical protein